MGYVLFRCETCSKSLMVGDVSIGSSPICPHCQNVADVPLPAIRFFCPWCEADLFASKEFVGEPATCPNCEQAIDVPACTTILCPKCDVALEIEEEYYRDLMGDTMECPSCGSNVTVPLIGPGSAQELREAVKSDRQVPAKKTIRLDRLLGDIPQAKSLEEGRCPYCQGEVEKTATGAYKCPRCRRVISLHKRKVSGKGEK